MKEIANITDFLLALECSAFAILLWSGGSGRLWTMFYASLAAASLAGGITHTFYDVPGTFEHLFWWDVTLLSIGLTSIYLFCIAYKLWNWNPSKDSSQLALTVKKPRLGPIAAIAFYIGFAGFVLTGLRPFLTAIVFYLPASIFLFASIIRLSSTKEVTFRGTSICGISGMALTFVAAGLQQAKVAIPALLLNHNALYHIIQGVGLYLLFLYGARLRGKGNKS